MMVGDSAYTKNLGVSLVDWITGGKVSQAMNALTGYLEGEYVDRYLDGEMYYEGKALVDLLHYWQTLPAAELVDYLSELGEGAGETIGISLGTGLVLDKLSGVSGGGTLITTTGKIVAGSTTATAGIAVSIVIGGVIVIPRQ